VLDKNQPLR